MSVVNCFSLNGIRRSAVLVVLALIPLLISAQPVFANDDKGADEAAAAQATAKKTNKRICKRIKTTGTHFRKKVCLKKSQWDHMAREAQDTMRDLGGRVGGSADS